MTAGDSSNNLDELSPASPSADATASDLPQLERVERQSMASGSVEPPPLPEPKSTIESNGWGRNADADTELDEHEDEDEDKEEYEDEEERRRWSAKGGLQTTEAVLGSMAMHLTVLISLALWMLPDVVHEIKTAIIVDMNPDPEDAMEPVTLQNLETSTTSISVLSANAIGGAASGPAGLIGAPALDQKLVEQLSSSGPQLSISHPLEGAPAPTRLIEATPDGALGDASAVVADYDDAFDRITQELLWMLSNSNVLVTWCFDQSESMKDDQQEIRSRINRVYSELGLVGQSNNQALTTAVTSYGERFLNHTRKPTGNVEEIQAAMDTVPVDPSGQELMCQAVALSITQHLKYVKQGDRQMALILVTDESGEREGNIQLLEQAIAAAREAKCRIFILGREAVFGYPYAHMKWKHPFTGHIHRLPIDRGPETAFMEQLQTDGFRRRYDAHPSGFGPYEQARMARETGGIFFMLPSLETDLVRGEKRIYELEAMRSYLPNLRVRDEQLAKRQSSMLRSMLCKIINDLNPYHEEVAKVMEVRYEFSPKPEQFLIQAREEQTKAKLYLQYLVAAEEALAQISKHRGQEVSPRWQANYDLIYAQVIAYIARTYEYGAYLEAFIANPKAVPLEKPNFHRLSSWHIEHSKTTVSGALTDAYIERASVMFDRVSQEHAGTPWAARAEWELSRGFGFELRERYSYYGPRAPTPTRSIPQIPIPKL